MNALQKYGFYGLDLVAGLSIEQEGNAAFLCICRRKAGRLEVQRTCSFDTLAELENWLVRHPAVPVVLFCEFPSKVEAMISSRSADPVSAVLGVKVDGRVNFCWQSWPCGEDHFWTCVVRREDLEHHFCQVAELSPRLAGLCLGRAAEVQLLRVLPGYNEAARYRYGGCYGFQGGMLTSNEETGRVVSREEVAKEVGVGVEFLGPYVAVWSFLRGSTTSLEDLRLRANGYRQEGKRRRTLALLLLTLLVLHLFLAGGNTFLERQLDSLSRKIQVAQPLLQELADTEEAILKKTNLWAKGYQMGMQKNHASIFLDHLASACPEGVQFGALLLFPREKEIPKFAHAPPLLLEGRAVRSGAVSELARAVQALPFFQRVEILHSEYRMAEGDYLFSLGIYFSQKNENP